MPDPEVIVDLRDIDIHLTREDGILLCHIWIRIPGGKTRKVAPFEIDRDTKLFNALRILGGTEAALTKDPRKSVAP